MHSHERLLVATFLVAATADVAASKTTDHEIKPRSVEGHKTTNVSRHERLKEAVHHLDETERQVAVH